METTASHRSPGDVLRDIVLSAGVELSSFNAVLDQTLGPIADKERALTNLVRFLETGFSASIIRDLTSYPVLLSTLLELVGQSQYIADILVRNPEYLRWLTTSNVLQQVKPARVFRAEASGSAALFEQTTRKWDALRRYHRREILRIGAADILQEMAVDDVLDQLSSLADATIESCVNVSVEEMRAAGEGQSIPNVAVIGLGKLGGAELNFSSDIDLMFVYDRDRQFVAPIGRYHSSHEVAVRLSERIVRALSEFTAEGHLYRVDMRLRPDGKSGPLALSIASYLTYYESRGEPWERQMLLKARVVGGHRPTGTKFLRSVEAFVHPRTNLRPPWSDISAMKASIERGTDIDRNIKLGTGGIRDIEFLVQGMQILHGGRHAGLRTGNTLSALQQLADLGIMDRSTSEQLQRSYRLFRTVEHRLQLMHGLQTHDLPVTPKERFLLAAKLGTSQESFEDSLGECRAFVRRAFEGNLGRVLQPGESSGHSDDRRWRSVEEGAARAAKELLSEASPSGTGLARTEALLGSTGHVGALRTALGVERLRKDILRALSYSRVVFERLRSQPLLLESIVANAEDLLGNAHAGWMDLLNVDLALFRVFNEVRSSIRFLAGSTGVRELETELTEVAEHVMRRAGGPSPETKGLCLLAMGKLGSREMGIGSDLDIVMIYDSTSVTSSAAESYLRRLLDRLSTGADAYKVDMRLRPEGKNAPLVTEISFLRQYLASRAELWEYMALTRARPILGDQRVIRKVKQLLTTFRGKKWINAGEYLRTMRTAMGRERIADGSVDLKVSPGGIADIEFIVQNARLSKGADPVSTYDALRSMRSGRLLSAGDRTTLLHALAELRAVETLLRLNSDRKGSSLRPAQEGYGEIAHFLGYVDPARFDRQLVRTMKKVERIFRSYTGKLAVKK